MQSRLPLARMRRRPMASITIRNFEDGLKRRLRIRAV